MLNKLFGLTVILVLLASCNSRSAETEATADDVLETSIPALFEDPMAFDGKNVKLEGIISHVCRTSGDKMRIMQDGSDLTVQIMLGNFTGRFDTDSEGMRIEIEGKVETEVTNIDELSELQDEECENTIEAIKAMKELGLDPNIRPFIHLIEYEIK